MFLSVVSDDDPWFWRSQQGVYMPSDMQGCSGDGVKISPGAVVSSALLTEKGLERVQLERGCSSVPRSPST